MKKRKTKSVYLLAILAIVLIAGACNINNPWIDDWWVGEVSPEPIRAAITTYTITFNMESGSYVDLVTGEGHPWTNPPEQVVQAGKATVYEPGLVEFKEPRKYFAGWWTAAVSGGTQWNFNTTAATTEFDPDGDGTIPLFARWSDAGNTITFELNAPGGSGMLWTDTTYPPKEEYVASGITLSQPKGFDLKPGPMADKYVFTGWYTWDDSVANGGNGDGIVDNSELTPWDFQTGVTSADTKLYAGWGTKTSSGNVLPPQTEPPKPVYAITFNDNDGNPDTYILPEDVVDGQKIPSPGAITRPGYTFTGWYTDEGYTTPWNFDTSVAEGFDPDMDGKIPLYAGWTLTVPLDYKITFNSNGGDYIDLLKDPTNDNKNDNPPPQTVTPGAGIVHEPGFVEPPEGKYFAGWFTDDNGNGTIDDGETVWDFDTTNAEDRDPNTDGNIPLIAGWSDNGYTVTFDAGGDFDQNDRFDPVNEIDWSKTIYTPKTEKVTAGTKLSQPNGFGLKSDDCLYPLADKYAFTGWYQDVNGNGIVDGDGTGPGIDDTKWDFSIAPTDNITLYAGWGTRTGSDVYLPENGGYPVPIYTISFNSDGANSTPNPETVIWGNKLPAPDAIFKDGYIFTGWYKNSNHNTPWDFETEIVNDDDDMFSGGTDDNAFTLYAGWEPIPYTYPWLDKYYYGVHSRGSGLFYYPFEFDSGVGDPWVDYDNGPIATANFKSQEDIITYLNDNPTAIAFITGFEDVQGDGLNTDREKSVYYSLCGDAGMANPEQLVLHTKLPPGEDSNGMIIGPNDSAGLAATDGSGHEAWVEIFMPTVRN